MRRARFQMPENLIQNPTVGRRHLSPRPNFSNLNLQISAHATAERAKKTRCQDTSLIGALVARTRNSVLMGQARKTPGGDRRSSLASGNDQTITARSYAGCAGRPTTRRCPGSRMDSGMPAGTAANGAAATQLALPPANAVSILEYMTSRPISRFVTGFQIVREPTCQAFQSAQPGPKPRGAQISVSTAVLLAS